MTLLPAGPAAPLSILEPEPSYWPAILVAAFLGAILWWWLKRRKKPAPPPAPPPVVVPPPVQADPDFVDQIRDRFGATGEYRSGLHALAEGLRAQLGAKSGHPLAFWTREEIEQRMGEIPALGVFEWLAKHRFGRHVPGQEEFDQGCELVRTAANLGLVGLVPGEEAEAQSVVDRKEES